MALLTSSNPHTVAVEQVLTFWVAVAKAEGSAEITASNSTGECGSMTLTAGLAAFAVCGGLLLTDGPGCATPSGAAGELG